jgi:hypothetical protein
MPASSRDGSTRPERAATPIVAPARSAGGAMKGADGPVSRVLSSAVIPLVPGSLPESSSQPGNGPGERDEVGARPFPYLALLRVGFTLPPPLPPGRCALTAPFHPYRSTRLAPGGRAVCFLWHFPSPRKRDDRVLPGTLPSWSSDFPPRSEDRGDRIGRPPESDPIIRGDSSRRRKKTSSRPRSPPFPPPPRGPRPPAFPRSPKPKGSALPGRGPFRRAPGRR